MNGAVIIDKPAGMTSHDVVARCRRILQERSIGHLGTLDPGASGVLPLLVGTLTRLAQFFSGRDKAYEGEIYFGHATTTYDGEGERVGAAEDAPPPSLGAIEAALAAFRGAIQQRPPAYSAKKVEGVRAYKLARQHLPVDLPPVTVTVHEATILAWQPPRLRLLVRCSTGTYIRSLAHDLGQAVGCPAHLAALRRTAVGEFTESRAITLERLAELAAGGRLEEALVPQRDLLTEWPAVMAPLDAQAKILQGRAVNLAEFSAAPMLRIFAPDGSLLAIGKRIAGSLIHPKLVLRNTQGG